MYECVCSAGGYLWGVEVLDPSGAAVTGVMSHQTWVLGTNLCSLQVAQTGQISLQTQIYLKCACDCGCDCDCVSVYVMFL